MVSVIVCAYNQEGTVGQALDSVLAQEGVEIEVIVGEDGSTDGTRAVVEGYVGRYSNVRLMPAAANKGLLRNYLDCLGEARGEYIAGCAGDDYWNDGQKLRRQVEFLDANPDCGVVHGAMLHLDVATGKVIRPPLRTPPEGRLGDRDVYFRHVVAAPTVCFRRELVRHIEREEWLRRGFLMEDLPMWIEFSRHTEFRFMPEYAVTYRVGQASSASLGGALEKRLRFAESKRDVRYYFWDKYRPEFPRRLITNKFRRQAVRFVVDQGGWRMFWRKAREYGVVFSVAIAIGEKLKGR